MRLQLLTPLLAALAPAVAEHQLFVATGGNDTAPGTREAPFATLPPHRP